MKTNIRFFKYFLNTQDQDIDIKEISEKEFLETPGNIEYKRNTIFQNGVNQICLTKTNNLV